MSKDGKHFIRWIVVLLVVAGLFFAILPRYLGQQGARLKDEVPSSDKVLPEMEKLVPDAKTSSSPDFSTTGNAIAKDRPAFGDKPGGLFGSPSEPDGEGG